MKADLEKIWNDEIQKDFVASLDRAQTEALLDLLIVTTFADSNVSLEERRGLSVAMAQLPELDAALELDSNAIVDRTEDLFERFGSNRHALLTALVERLGTETARRHAFRTAVQFLASDGFAPDEQAFVRELGERMEIEESVVEFALRDASDA